MKKKSLSSSGFLDLRTLIGLLLCAATACSVLIPMKSGLAYLHPQAPANSSQRTLTFEERVSYQRAIEDVYWRHRIWPKERPDPKPSLDAVMSQAQLEKKVEDYLRKSQALENYWQRPITAKQLQAEVDRMANHTKQPEVLRELFEALGNDPFVIAECLARPALVERLLASWYAYDQRIHGELKQRAEAELQTHPAVGQMKQLSGKYGEIELVRKESAHAKDNRAARNSVKLNNHEWNQTVQRLVGIFSDGSVAAGVSPANDTSITHLKAGTVSPLQEDETRYYVTTVVNKTNDHLKLATVSWPKEVTQVIPRALGQRGQRDISQRTSDAPSNLDGGTWTVTNSLNTARYLHTTTLLPNGMVLVAGGLDNTFTATASAELYNPANGTWTPTGSLNTARTNHTATLLTNGRVLVAGGLGSGALASAELYDPATGTWTVTGSLNTARESHTATLLSNGMVLVAAGYDSNTHVLASAELYDPVSGSWTPTGNLNTARTVKNATLLTNDMVLVAGGSTNSGILASAELYNPVSGSWTLTGSLNNGRSANTATLLPNGMVLVAGGDDITFPSPPIASAELYDPESGTWTFTGSLNTARDLHSATLLTNGMVLVAAGADISGNPTASAELYDPATGSWSVTGSLNTARELHSATLLTNGMVLAAGGFDNNFDVSASAELYESQPSPTPTPTPTPTPRVTPRPRPTPHLRPTPPD